MKQQLFYFLAGLLMLTVTGCEKENTMVSSDGTVDLYLIDSFSKIGHSSRIDESSVITQNTPLLNYSDFLSYDSSNYTFELSDRGKEAIENLNLSTQGLAFAIKADDALIYTGYFWPSYSSASCDWVVIDPIMASTTSRIQVKLGYPGLVEGQVITDRRNDERIISIFKRDGKLK